MATKATIKFIENDEVVASIYNDWDGYLSGLGYDIATWLLDKCVISGISGQTMEEGFANGIGCLAAQFIKTFKTKIGNLYLCPINQKEEFNYIISLDEKSQFIIEIDDRFKGSPEKLIKLITKN